MDGSTKLRVNWKRAMLRDYYICACCWRYNISSRRWQFDRLPQTLVLHKTQYFLMDLTQYPVYHETLLTCCHAWRYVNFSSIRISLVTRSSVQWTWTILGPLHTRAKGHDHVTTRALDYRPKVVPLTWYSRICIMSTPWKWAWHKLPQTMNTIL